MITITRSFVAGLAICISACEEPAGTVEGVTRESEADSISYDAPSEKDLKQALQAGMTIEEAREALGPEMFSDVTEEGRALDWIWDDGTKQLQLGDLVGVTLYFRDGKLDGWIPSKHVETLEAAADPSGPEQ